MLPHLALLDGITDPVNAGAHLGSGKMNTVSGAYTGSNSFQGYAGEWITLILPVKIHLAFARFYYQVGHESRLPHTYRIYGSNDGSGWTLLVDKTGAVYINGVHDLPVRNPYTIKYNYFALVVNAMLVYNIITNQLYK